MDLSKVNWKSVGLYSLLTILVATFITIVYFLIKTYSPVKQATLNQTGGTQQQQRAVPLETTAPIQVATQAPRPTGPGPFACSVRGDCKHWDPAVEAQACTVTYADSACLDQCNIVEKRCSI